MPQPTHGDALIRDAAAGYVVVDAVSGDHRGGPYLTIAEAALNARRLVVDGHVWRETADRHGRPLGEPFLLELQASTPA